MPHPHYHRLAWIAVLLLLATMAFGTFVQVFDAVQACAGWPACAESMTPPGTGMTPAATVPGVVKAVAMPDAGWRLVVHRGLAGLVALLVLALAVLAARRLRGGVMLVMLASGLAVVSVLTRQTPSVLLLAAAVLVLTVWALRPDRVLSPRGDFSRLSSALLALVILQVWLGARVAGGAADSRLLELHALSGLATLATLTFLAGRASPRAAVRIEAAWRLRPLLLIGLAVIALQLVSGAWVSVRHAGLACGVAYPACLGQWWPAADFAGALGFAPGRGMDEAGRVAIHLVHRWFALVALATVYWLGRRLRRVPQISGWGTSLIVLVAAQFVLGVLSVVTGMPAKAVVAHHLIAVLLLLVAVLLLACLRPPRTGAESAER